MDTSSHPEPETVSLAMQSLLGDRFDITDAAHRVPNHPGLYAVFASPAAARQLGVDAHDVDMPIYVGKAEASLVSRELKTHFDIRPGATSRTGSSTLRRSFAALLRDDLALTAVPRNKAKPAYFANYSLEPDGDSALTNWMHTHLELAVWSLPTGVLIQDLRVVEKSIVRAWAPPLNLDGVPRPWGQLKQARADMAAAARSWSPHSGA